MQSNEKLFCEQCPERKNIRKQAVDDMVEAIRRAMPDTDSYETKAFVAYVLEEFWRD